VTPGWETDLTLGEVFAKLGLSEEHAAAFTSLGLTIAELDTCNEEDLKVSHIATFIIEGNLPVPCSQCTVALALV